MRQDDIIKDIEAEYGVTLDPNFQSDQLCDGDGCRHENCSCWQDFEADVRHQLANQAFEEIDKDARAKVHASVAALVIAALAIGGILGHVATVAGGIR